MTRTTTSTIFGSVAFLFAIAASVPLDVMRKFLGNEGAVFNPDGSPEVAPPKMMLEVSNDELEDAEAKKESDQANSTSKTMSHWGSWGRRRRWMQTMSACAGKVLKIFGTDKELSWTLACTYIDADTVRFVGTWKDDTEGAYYVETMNLYSSQVRALLTGWGLASLPKSCIFESMGNGGFCTSLKTDLC